jgi:hypothetical protein
MKKYNQSALSAKGRRVIFEEAKKGGVIIQRKSTSGEVLDEFVMNPYTEYSVQQEAAERAVDLSKGKDK